MNSVNVGAVVSDEHADASTCVQHLTKVSTSFADGNTSRPRLITPDEVRRHNGQDGSFWAVIDGFVVDASEFVDSHPGGLRKLLSADHPATGATGQPFGFSFSRGRNAHFPETGKCFRNGVERYVSGGSPTVTFKPYGSLEILGRLQM